jgi:hypothetical protein
MSMQVWLPTTVVMTHREMDQQRELGMIPPSRSRFLLLDERPEPAQAQ